MSGDQLIYKRDYRQCKFILIECGSVGALVVLRLHYSATMGLQDCRSTRLTNSDFIIQRLWDCGSIRFVTRLFGDCGTAGLRER